MFKISLSEALKRLGGPDPTWSTVFTERKFEIGIYRPETLDPQTPHKRDEIYVIAGGSGLFLCEGRRTEFGPGDVLFVPAGVEHRFVDFTDEFSAWVVFVA